MKGAAVKDQLSDAIEIANSQPITYFVSVDKGSGEVTPASVSVKKKENFELIFTPEEDWQFICWETIDAQTGKVVPDVIKFENPQKTQTKAYVINPKEKVLIHPKCVQLPAVVSVEPQNANYVNIPIVIKFNIPVEASECEQKDSQFKYTNISLTCNGKEVDDYFEAPVFNEDKTELTLKPKIVDVDEDHPDSVLLKTYIDNLKLGAAYIDISFSENIKIANGENNLPLKNAGKDIYSVRYVPVIENTPPLKHEFIIGRNPDILKDNKNYTGETFHKQKIQDKPAGMDNDTYYNLVLQNSCNGKIYIYGSYFDDESGVKSVVIKERLIKDIYGYSVTNNFTSTEYDISSDFFITENGETEFFIPYEIVSYIDDDYIENDGTLSLQIYVLDECKNTAEVEEFFIVKKTTSVDIYAGLGGPFYPDDFQDSWIDFDTYLTSLQNSCYINLTARSDDRMLNSIVGLKEDAYEINVEYFDKYNKIQIVNANFPTLINTNSISLDTYLRDLNIGFIPGTSIIVNVKDVLNNSKTFTMFKFPEKDMKIHIIKEAQNSVEFYDNNGKMIFPVLIRQSKQNPNSAKECSLLYEDLESGYIYQIMLDGIILDTTFEYEDLDSFVAEDDDEADKVEITDISIKPSTKTGYYTATVTIAEDSWNKFQVIYCKWSNGWHAYKPGSNVLLLDLPINTLYSSNEILTIYGFNGNNCSSTTTKTIPKKCQEDSDFLDFDNAPPSYNPLCFQAIGDDVVLLFDTITDVGSGIKQGSLIIQNSDPKINKIYELDFKNSQSIKIPMWECLPSTENPSNLIISVYDNAGNHLYKTPQLFYAWNPWFPEFEKQKNENGEITGNLNLSYVGEHEENIYGYNFQDDGSNNNSGNIGFEHNLENYSIVFNTSVKCEKVGYINNSFTLTVKKNELDSISNEHPFVKLVLVDYYCSGNYGNNYYDVPRYYYNGTPGNQETDYIIPNGSNNDSMLICSDKPVFVHTIATSVSLDKCKNWDYSEWEFYKQEYGEQILDCGVSITQNGSPVDIATTKIYQIPTDKIAKDQNYIVIAHYSNDNVLMSPIMTK